MKRILYILVCAVAMATSMQAQVIFEAEDANYSSGKIDTKHIGFTGDGFVDTENAAGEWVEWTINTLKAYNDTIFVRYALGKVEERFMEVYINETLTDTINFDQSGEAFTDYIYKYTVASLVKGENKVKLVAINIEGAPNLDHLMAKLDTNEYFQVTASVNGGGGSVTLSPESGLYLYGTRVTVVPTAETGNIFAGWSGDFLGKKTPLSFTVDKDYTVSANFSFTLPAFPGAEGFGKNVTGGRGGKVIEVTNLNDSGAGSLRDAIKASGARTIVFRVGGTIDLKSDLKITNGNVTIAGQTAPGGGITLTGYPLKVSTDNVILRYIRARLGDDNLVEDDAMNGTGHKNIIIDHCTMSWSVDETASFYDNENFTMQYCLISESLYNSVHSKGNHGYGGIWGGRKASFHHNLLAHHTSRNPRFCGSRFSNQEALELVDFRNNVIYNAAKNTIYGAEGGDYNLVGNYYKYGPSTNSGIRARIISADKDAGDYAQAAGVYGQFYIDGNYIYGNSAVTDDNWLGVVHTGLTEESIYTDTAYASNEFPTQTAEMAFEHVLAQVGACIPYRDPIDTRVINEVVNGTATYGGIYGEGLGIIDKPEDVGGLPVLAPGVAPVDTDKDGMPDAWENARGLNPNDATDGNGDDNTNGYTNLEEYLNGLVEERTYLIRPTNFTVASVENYVIKLTWEDITDNEENLILEGKVDDGDFTLIETLAANTTQYSHTVSAPGIYTYRLKSANSVDTSLYTEMVEAEIATNTVIHNADEIGYRLYPNPVTDQLTIYFAAETASTIEISLLDITGKKVKTLENNVLAAGNHTLPINVTDLQQGVYMVSLTINSKQYIQRVVKF